VGSLQKDLVLAHLEEKTSRERAAVAAGRFDVVPDPRELADGWQPALEQLNELDPKRIYANDLLDGFLTRNGART